MTVAWLAAAVGLLLVPVPVPGTVRARALAARFAGAGQGRPGRASRRSPPLPPGVRARLRTGAAGVAPRAVAGAVAAGGPAGLAATGLGPGLGLAIGVALLSATLLARAALARRRERRRSAQVLAAAQVLIAELESGARPAAALAASGPVAPDFAAELAAAARAAAAGEPPSSALLRGADPGPAQSPAAPVRDRAGAELAPLGHAWRLAEEGVPLGEVLTGVAADLAACAETRRAVAAACAGARSSAGLLAGLPLLGLGLGAAMGAHPLAFLGSSASGHALCCAGAILDAAGVLWTQRLVRRAERP